MLEALGAEVLHLLEQCFSIMFCGCEAAWGRGEVPPGNGSASFSLDLRRWGRSQGGSCVAECRDLCRAVVREQLHEVSQRFLCLKHRVGTLLTWSSWEWVFSSFLISPEIYRLVPIDASNAPRYFWIDDMQFSKAILLHLKRRRN